jgi:hypothetical protein
VPGSNNQFIKAIKMPTNNKIGKNGKRLRKYMEKKYGSGIDSKEWV